MLLVRAGAEVVVREHGAQGVVLALVIDDRVGPPQLRRPLRAAKRVLRAKRVLVVRLALSRSARRAQPLVQQRLVTGVPTRAGGMNVAAWAEQRVRQGRQRLPLASSCDAAVVRKDALAHLVRREGAILIVPAIARAVAGGDVELHQMDVLANGVGRRVDLKIVRVQRRRHEIGLEVDAIA